MKNWLGRIPIILTIVMLLVIGVNFQPIRYETSEPYTYTTYQISREEWDAERVGFADYNGTLETFDKSDFDILGRGQYNLTLPHWSTNNIIPVNESISSITLEWTYYHSFSGNNPPRTDLLVLQQDLRFLVFIGDEPLESWYNPLPSWYGPIVGSTKTVSGTITMNFTSSKFNSSEINQVVFQGSFFVNATCDSNYYIQYISEWRVDIEYSQPQNSTIDVPVVNYFVPAANPSFITAAVGICIVLWVLFEILIWHSRRSQSNREHT